MDLRDAIEKANRDVIEPYFIDKRELEYGKLETLPIDDDLKDEIKRIFDKTLYVSWDDTISFLDKSITQFLSQVEGDFYISLNKKKFSSELIFLCIFWDRLKDRVIDIISLSDLPPGPQTILFIDDFVISGTSIAAQLDEYFHETKRPEGEVKYYVVCACATDSGSDTIRDFATEVFTSGQLSRIEVESKYLPNIRYSGYNPESKPYYEGNERIYPFYSDHKISNDQANIPFIYHYGRIGYCEGGCLMTYPPDEFIKFRLWKKYFKNLMKEPTLFKYGTSVDTEFGTT